MDEIWFGIIGLIVLITLVYSAVCFTIIGFSMRKQYQIKLNRIAKRKAYKVYKENPKLYSSKKSSEDFDFGIDFDVDGDIDCGCYPNGTYYTDVTIREADEYEDWVFDV